VASLVDPSFKPMLAGISAHNFDKNDDKSVKAVGKPSGG